jgi:PDZ domain
VTITKEEGEKLGMHIKGGTGSTKQGNPLDASDQGVFVSKINSSGAASRQGGLQVTNLNSISNFRRLKQGNRAHFSRCFMVF